MLKKKKKICLYAKKHAFAQAHIHKVQVKKGKKALFKTAEYVHKLLHSE